MRIFHIKDSYLFNRQNKTGTHRYAVYKDKKSHETRLVQLTHLYEIAPRKARQIRNGHIKEYQLGCYKFPSGIQTGYKTKDIDGNPIVLTRENSTPSYSLSEKDSKRIRKIAKKKIN